MASVNVASALTALTSEHFTPSDSADNSALEALVMEYFAGSDEITDHESSDDSDGETGNALSKTSFAWLDEPQEATEEYCLFGEESVYK